MSENLRGERSSLLGKVDEFMQKHFDELQAEIKRIEEITTPLRDQRNALQAKIQPVEDEMRALATKVREIEQGHGLFELKMDLGKVARALGGRSLGNQVEGEGERILTQAEADAEAEGERQRASGEAVYREDGGGPA